MLAPFSSHRRRLGADRLVSTSKEFINLGEIINTLFVPAYFAFCLCVYVFALHSDALKRMLNLNQPLPKAAVATEPVWKVSDPDLPTSAYLTGRGEEHVLGGVANHIKAFKPHLLTDQREFSC